jgi:DNA-binding CsgD family transcriptional regulator
MEKEQLENISKKLSVLISLSIMSNDNYKTLKEKTAYLKKFNLANIEIAEILNTSKNTIEVNLTNLKNKKK